MCLFQSGKDIPPGVRLSLRTLQYLVIPLLSLAILVVGLLHSLRGGEDFCPAQPNLPLWHAVAGSSGLLIPILYLLFDEINPRISRRFPALSELFDNAVVFILPLYLIFEVAWLITGTVWVFGSSSVSDPASCDHTLYVFSLVVIINFWIHLLTPLIFMLSLCLTRIFPFCGYSAYWNLASKAINAWGRSTRLLLASTLSLPLGISMIAVGVLSLSHCRSNPAEQEEVLSRIPIWLLVTGASLLFVPSVYLLYDKYCKHEDSGPLIKALSQGVVITYLLLGLSWAILGFLWVFGSVSHETCGHDSATYRFAFSTLIILNVIMDTWICYKICVVLHWAFLSDD